MRSLSADCVDVVQKTLQPTIIAAGVACGALAYLSETTIHRRLALGAVAALFAGPPFTIKMIVPVSVRLLPRDLSHRSAFPRRASSGRRVRFTARKRYMKGCLRLGLTTAEAEHLLSQWERLNIVRVGLAGIAWACTLAYVLVA